MTGSGTSTAARAGGEVTDGVARNDLRAGLAAWWHRVCAIPRDPFDTLPLVNCVFLLFAFEGFHSLAGYLGIAAVVLVAGFLFATIPAIGDDPMLRVGWLLALVAALGSLWFFIQGGVLFFGIFVAMAAALLLPLRAAVALVIPTGASMLAIAMRYGNGVLFTLGCVALVGGLGTAFGIDADLRRSELRVAREQNAMLAVALERARIGRDLHDILGHSLTAIAVKADLSRKLLSRDPQAADEQLAEVVEVARRALADVRATSSGMQQVRLAGELVGARSVLDAAGILCRMPSAVPDLDDETSELFGYALREAITNVVRHADATLCVVEADEDSLTVSDDGRGYDIARHPAGSGLAGLRIRAEQAGWQLVTTSGEGTTRLALRRAESG